MRRVLNGANRYGIFLSSSRRKITMGSKYPRIHLALDFDGTLTRTDTLEELGNTALRIAASGCSRTKINWSHFADAYMKDYNTHVGSYRPGKNERHTIQQEVAWLESLREVEEASMARAKREDIFNRCSKEQVNSMAFSSVDSGRVTMWQGWAQLIATLASSATHQPVDSTVRVISVNWSRYWIHCCLSNAAEKAGDRVVRDFIDIDETTPSEKRFFDISANEVCGFGSDDKIKIHTSSDKVRYFKSSYEESNPGLQSKQGLSIYVGDSTTDLECLLAADIGICMRDKPMGSGQKELAETFDRLGIEVRGLETFNEADVQPVKESTIEKSNTKVHGGSNERIWWIRDFNDINDWLKNWSPRFLDD